MLQKPRTALSARAMLLWVAVLWHALVMLSSAYSTERANELDHLVQHSVALQHHHDDHSLHWEDADASADHTHTDGGFNAAALLTHGWPSAWMAQPLPPQASLTMTIPFPHHDGPLRPPRHAV